jgi:hypothetical protein
MVLAESNLQEPRLNTHSIVSSLHSSTNSIVCIVYIVQLFQASLMKRIGIMMSNVCPIWRLAVKTSTQNG